MRDMNTPQYIAWRRKVFRRDKYKCQFPGCTNTGPINSHHIFMYAKYPALRFNINNGICLCIQHHNLVTGNEEQYEAMFTNIIRNKSFNMKALRVLRGIE